jgi:carbon-monoxide dehydrogenase large subunit
MDHDLIHYQFGDTDQVAMGTGTFGSRSACLAGSAVFKAADKIIEKGRLLAAHLMEAAEGDVEFADGKFTVAGTDKSLDLAQIAQTAFKEGKLPPHMEPGLHARADYAAEDGGTYPNGAHICEVEIDEATGKVRLTRYSAVDDVGVMINPLLVEGQVLGGIGQGAGQALVEDMRYDPETGQPLTGSFLDYCMPRADDFCHFDLANNVVPTTRNPLGVKGAGEAGTVGALPAIMNAVNDALFAIGAPAVEMPASAEKLWRAIRAAKAA